MAVDRKKMFAKVGLGIGAFAAVIQVLDWRAIWDVAGQLTMAPVLLVLIIILSEFP
jgi:hypothetical protein